MRQVPIWQIRSGKGEQEKARESKGEGGNARETTQKKVPENIQSSEARESNG